MRAWIALLMLCFIYVLNFLDRSLLAVMTVPIKASLHITNLQIGLIGGFYFALFYCLISIPIGWVADKTNRVWLLALACALWSAATMACGLAANYPQLAASRMAVGIGEAGGVPPSYAIISDYFPSGRRATALGVYNLGPPIGLALGVAFGAYLAAAYSWRAAFLVLGSIGVAAALLLPVIVREPVRGALDPKPTAIARDDFAATIKAFFSRREFVLAALASGVTQIITYGSGNFATAFLQLEKGMTPREIAVYYALVVAVGMGGGIYVSGRIIDRFTRRSKAAYALVPALTLALAVPPYLGYVWAPSWPMALLFLLGPNFLNYFYLSSCVALVQQDVAPSQRVLSGALLLLIMNLMGLGLGPAFVGAVSDYVHAAHPHNSLQIAFYALAPFYAVAIGLFLWLAAVLKRDPLHQGAP